MDKQESAPTTSSANTIIKHIFKFDDDTKSTLMNLSQYMVLAIIPVAILQNISEKVFPEFDASKGTLELLAEILGQSLMSIVGLFFIHRVITAVPTFSGSAMGDLNLFSIIVVFLLTSFMFDGKVEKKFKAISNRMMELWDGKSSDDKDKNKQVVKPQGGGSVVSVSQPISRGGAPTHAPSRADYLNSPNAQTSSTQMMPAQPPPQQQTPQNNGQEQYSNLPLEPAAYNSGGGGFATF
tara:strand:- start:319 stop:1032 length:714 start_codon:yes stop_codon:yes gene_type:complete